TLMIKKVALLSSLSLTLGISSAFGLTKKQLESSEIYTVPCPRAIGNLQSGLFTRFDKALVSLGTKSKSGYICAFRSPVKGLKLLKTFNPLDQRVNGGVPFVEKASEDG